MNNTMYNTAGYPSPNEDEKTYGEEESDQEVIDDLNEIRAADALDNPDPEEKDLAPTEEPLPENDKKDSE